MVGCDHTLALLTSTPCLSWKPTCILFWSPRTHPPPSPAPLGVTSPAGHQVSAKRHPQRAVSHRSGRGLVPPRLQIQCTAEFPGSPTRDARHARTLETQGACMERSVFRLMLPTPGTKTGTQTTAETKMEKVLFLVSTRPSARGRSGCLRCPPRVGAHEPF